MSRRQFSPSPWSARRLASLLILFGWHAAHEAFVPYCQRVRRCVPLSRTAVGQNGWKATTREEQKRRILDCLSKSQGECMSTLSIAKAVVGDSGIKKDVNPLLYQLVKEGQIVQTRIEGDTNWHWMLKATENARDTSTSTADESVAGPSPFSPGTSTVRLCPTSTSTLDDLGRAASDREFFRSLAKSLEPKYASDVERMINSTLVTVRETADQYLGNGSTMATVNMIGSRNYGTDINGSDIDYVLNVSGVSILKESWRKFATVLNESITLRGCVINGSKGISIHLKEDPVLQFVPRHGDFEYGNVPYSNLIAGKEDRDEMEKKLNSFFESYQGARNAARVLKGCLTSCVQDLPKQPWSLILTHMLFREARHCNHTTDVDGHDLLRHML
ncbi:Putative E3 ubiquitin-protein ligase HERC1 [Durusdinium trenchii]|uniref:E3 ubiquitin-protein ligase HERC1 n=1 Tax=Durusdinium trenchii TaxID=1381693 RepID=A0ABP0MJX3_9DINO